MKSLNEVINTLENYKAEAVAKAEAWRAVEIAKKKDGTEYQKIGQAVTGAKFGHYYPVEDAQHPYLTISTRTKTGKYTTDSAPAFFILTNCQKMTNAAPLMCRNFLDKPHHKPPKNCEKI